LEKCESGRSLRFNNLSTGPEKFNELFQKILSVIVPKCEHGISSIEGGSHTNLTTMFSGNNVRT